MKLIIQKCYKYLKLCFAIALIAGLSTTIKAGVVDDYGQLSVSGNRIVNKNGTAIALHGMSLSWSQ